MLPAELAAQRRDLLTDTATELFTEHWTGADSENFFIPAHESLELAIQACNKW